MTARPTRLTDEMRLAAALETAKDVQRECSDFRGEDTTELAEQIASQARYDHMDGYELAKKLDDHCGWEVDTMMVEALDNWSCNARLELEKAQKAWAAETNPQPPLPIGARVKLKGLLDTGEITGLYEHGTAQYLVKIDGDRTAETNQSRRIVYYEDVIALQDGIGR